MLATLRFVRGLAPGSQILFEVLLPESQLPERERKVAEFAAKGSAARGEPWLSRFEPAEMRAQLDQLGYESSLHLTVEEAQARYFHGRTDGLAAPVMAQFLVATV